MEPDGAAERNLYHPNTFTSDEVGETVIERTLREKAFKITHEAIEAITPHVVVRLAQGTKGDLGDGGVHGLEEQRDLGDGVVVLHRNHGRPLLLLFLLFIHGGASRRTLPTLAAAVAAGCFLVLLSAVHQHQQLGFAHVNVRPKSSFVLVAPAAEAVARARHKARYILWVAQPELRAARSANVQPAILEVVLRGERCEAQLRRGRKAKQDSAREEQC